MFGTFFCFEPQLQRTKMTGISVISKVNSSITHLLSHILAPLQVMVTVWKDFRLHNWHNAMLRGREEGRAISALTTHNSTSSPGFVTFVPTVKTVKREPANRVVKHHFVQHYSAEKTLVL